MTRDEHKEMMTALGQLSANIDHMTKLSSSSTTSSINVSAGGIGVWICACACMMMLSISMVGGLWISREFTRMDREMTDRREAMDRMQTYLSAIYAQAPHLQPSENKDAN